METDTAAVCVALAVRGRVVVCEVEYVTDRVVEGTPVLDCVCDSEPEVLVDTVRVCVGVTVGVAVYVRDSVVEDVTKAVRDGVPVAVAVQLALAVMVAVAEAVLVRVAEAVMLL